MEINQIIKSILIEKEGFFILETSNINNLDLIENNIKEYFYEKQYEIDSSFLLLHPEENSKFISVDQIRNIKKEFLHTNVLNINRVIFIKEINLLNTNSINALLKIIEEIPHKTFFIFCTSNIIKIPETVLSRARIIRINDKLQFNDINNLISEIASQNQNISEDLLFNLINPFLKLQKANFLENIKLFNKDQLDICSIIFLRIVNHYLKLNKANKKLYKYLYELHSSYVYDLNESLQFNTLTNDLIAIYFTRLNSNLIKYAK